MQKHTKCPTQNIKVRGNLWYNEKFDKAGIIFYKNLKRIVAITKILTEIANCRVLG